MNQETIESVTCQPTSNFQSLNIMVIGATEVDFFIITKRLEKEVTTEVCEFYHEFDSVKAIQYLRDNKLDLIMLDYSIDVDEKFTSLTDIKKLHPLLPVILIFASKHKYLGRQAVQLGADDFLYKEQMNGQSLKKAVDYVIDRKNYQVELKENNFKYKYVFENSLDAIYLSSLEGEKLKDFNHSMEKLLGYVKEELEELSISNLYDDPEDIHRFIKELEKEGRVQNFETNLIRKNGQRIECLINSTVRKNKFGEIIGYQGIIRDVTALNQSKRALKELNKSLEEKVNERTTQLTYQTKKVELKNKELLYILNALQKAKVGRKALTITFGIAIILFVLAEGLIEPQIDRFALKHYGSESSFAVGLSIKAILLILIKPIEMIVEVALRRKAMKNEIKMNS